MLKAFAVRRASELTAPWKRARPERPIRSALQSLPERPPMRQGGSLMRIKSIALVVLLACCISGADEKTKDKTKYELKYRPAVGQQMSYGQSIDMDLKISASGGGNQHVEQSQKMHTQVVVNSDELLEVRDDGDGLAGCAKKIVFGKNCWTAIKINNQPT